MRLILYLLGIPHCIRCGCREPLLHFDGYALCREHAAMARLVESAMRFGPRPFPAADGREVAG